MPAWPIPSGHPAIYPSSPGGITPPTLNAWQLQYNGVTMGAGVAGLGVTNIEGIGGLGTMNTGDQPFPRDTGEYVGTDAEGGKDITLDFWIDTNIVPAFETIGAAFQVSAYTPQPLWIQLPGGAEIMCVMCRPRTLPSAWDALVAAGAVWKPSVTLHANDPRVYSAGKALYNASSGATAYTLAVNNAGNREVRPVLILNGGSSGLHSPSITNNTIGSDAVTAFQSGFVVDGGDTVVVDLGTPHTVVYHPGGVGVGTPYNVYNMLNLDDTTWWTLLPGTNEITFSVSSGTIDNVGNTGVWWADAYSL